jgi:hypothetical protein
MPIPRCRTTNRRRLLAPLPGMRKGGGAAIEGGWISTAGLGLFGLPLAPIPRFTGVNAGSPSGRCEQSRRLAQLLAARRAH